MGLTEASGTTHQPFEATWSWQQSCWGQHPFDQRVVPHHPRLQAPLLPKVGLSGTQVRVSNTKGDPHFHNPNLLTLQDRGHRVGEPALRSLTCAAHAAAHEHRSAARPRGATCCNRDGAGSLTQHPTHRCYWEIPRVD